MKKKIFVANWKEHKNTAEAKEWLNEFSKHPFNAEEKEVVICPSFTLLPIVKEEVARLQLSVTIGSQDFPAFDEGAYTGEESPKLLAEYVTYAIIGHSERRVTFSETDEMLNRKVVLSNQFGIKPIFCVQQAETPIPQHVSIVAYEPVFAIGTGTADTSENAESVARRVREKVFESGVIYGGSVTPENVRGFIEKDAIQGVLVGSGSLSPETFAKIVNA